MIPYELHFNVNFCTEKPFLTLHQQSVCPWWLDPYNREVPLQGWPPSLMHHCCKHPQPVGQHMAHYTHKKVAKINTSLIAENKKVTVCATKISSPLFQSFIIPAI